ncbi:nucleotidyltransferase family protein [Oleiharenicola lentus]|uniref:nucleotidyltransferase family protein n=1 Tax=Oleiharenicola lentus TaxID=2508720 RepID=UPI003F66A3D5
MSAFSKHYDVIVLAAGDSSRMGLPAQLMEAGCVPQLRHVLSAATASQARDVLVVLGSNAEMIGRTINDLHVIVVTNRRWEDGLNSSIGCGMRTLRKPDPEAVILTLGDQMDFQIATITGLIATHERADGIVTTSPQGARMPPSLFGRSYFWALQNMSGDNGRPDRER